MTEAEELDLIDLMDILEIGLSIKDIIEYIDLKSHHFLPNNYNEQELINYIENKYWCKFQWEKGALRVTDEYR